jgi:phage gpG-like protein
MKAQFTQRDAITPELRRLVQKLDGSGRQAALEIMGEVVRTAARESFTDETARVKPWPNKKDGTPATLVLTTALSHSYRVEATPRVVTVGSDRKYALTHQLGDRSRGIPARPMLPVVAGELTAQVKADIVAAIGDWLSA